jgi:hypothetical protein
MNTLEIDNLLKNHPHSRPVFKGVYARNTFDPLSHPIEGHSVFIHACDWLYIEVALTFFSFSFFCFFHNTCLASNNTNFCTMSVAIPQWERGRNRKHPWSTTHLEQVKSHRGITHFRSSDSRGVISRDVTFGHVTSVPPPQFVFKYQSWYLTPCCGLELHFST